MLSNLAVEIILMSLEYLTFDELESLAWTSKRIMGIVRRNLPTALRPKITIELITISEGEVIR